MSRLRVAHNPNEPCDFLAAPERVGAEPGGRKNYDLEKMSVSLESGAQSESPDDFSAAPERVVAEPGREENT